MRIYKNHFGNHIFLGSDTDPYETTHRLLNKGIIKLPKESEIEVPQSLIDSWFKIWQEQFYQAELLLTNELQDKVRDIDDNTRYNMIVGTYINLVPASDGFLSSGSWDWVLSKRINAYKQDQKSKSISTAALQSETLISAAKRETVKIGREALDQILTTKGDMLSQNEKSLLEKFFLYNLSDPLTNTERLEVEGILARIYSVDNLVNETPWNPNTGIPENAQTFQTTDWENQTKDIQTEVAIKDAQYVSPLETAFLKAGDQIKQDVQTVYTTVSNNDSSSNKNLFLYLGLGLLAIKLLRR